jgi:hydrogenase maturation protease
MIEDLSNLDFLIVIDVVKTGQAAGTVVKIAGDEIPVFFRRKLSPHQIALPDVLASLELLDAMPKEIIVLGVEPISLELGMEMTDTVAAKVPLLVEMAVMELRARDYLFEARTSGVA